MIAKYYQIICTYRSRKKTLMPGSPELRTILTHKGIPDKRPSFLSREVNTFRHSYAFIHRLRLLFVYDIKAKLEQVTRKTSFLKPVKFINVDPKHASQKTRCL